jgi:hypothetical protein
MPEGAEGGLVVESLLGVIDGCAGARLGIMRRSESRG